MNRPAIVRSRQTAPSITLLIVATSCLAVRNGEKLITRRSAIMGNEDVAAGKAKQVKGKVNDVVGAIKGDTSQQVKGKVQGAVGKVQEALGKKPK